MKRLLKNCRILFFFLFILCLAGCVKKTEEIHLSPIQTFQSYIDIPGITNEEIAAIKLLQKNHASFNYGVIHSTEAFIKNDGRFGGYSSLLCELLSNLFGIPFNLKIFNSNDLLDKLDSGEIDFSGNMMTSEEYLKKYIMSDTIAERQFVRIRLESSPSVEQIQEKRKVKYAFAADTPIEDAVGAVIGRDSYEPVMVDNYSQAYQVLENGEADAYIASSVNAVAFIDYDDIIIEDFFPLIFNPVSMAAAKQSLQPIISVFTKALRNGMMPYLNKLYNQGYKDYLKHKMSVWLTNDERVYINKMTAQNNSIPIAAYNSNYPLSFYNIREREWQGIYFDLLEEVKLLTGLNFNVAHDEFTGFLVINEMLLSGKAVLIPELIWKKEREELYIWSDNVILNDHYALASKIEHSNITLNDILHERIGLARNTIHAEMFMQWFPNHMNIVQYDSIDDAFKGLQNNEVDMVMTTQRRLLQITHFMENPGYKANIIFNQPIETRFVFNKNQSILRSIIEKALKLTNVDGIAVQWTQRTYDYRTKVIEAQRPLMLGAIILFSLILILATIIFIVSKVQSIKLKKDHERTRVMLDTLPMACFIGNADGSIYDCNTEAVRLFELKNKKEFIDNFKKLSPEYQPDGRKSIDATLNNGFMAMKDGKYVFNWTHQLLDKTQIPTVVTLESVVYRNEKVLIAYVRDIREQRKMMGEIERQNELFKAVNSVSSILLDPDIQNFDDNLIISMGILAKAVDVDRVCIWKNHKKDGRLCCTLTYDWVSSFRPPVLGEYYEEAFYDETLPGWEEILSQGKCINNLVRDLSAAEQMMFKAIRVLSVFIAPVFVHDLFWGFVGFDNCHNERAFTDNESMIMRSSGRMIANAFIRNGMTQNLLDITTKLEAAVDKANEANTIKTKSLNSLERILDSIDAFIYVTVPGTGELLFVNKKMKKTFNIEHDDIVGKYCYKVFGRNTDQMCDFCPCFQLNYEPDKIIVWDEYADVLDRYIRHADCYIDWPSGEKVHLQHAVDITELLVAKEQAEQSSRYKSAFLATVSHEIRTPMNSILGIAEIQLQDEDLRPETEDAFSKIYESGDLLLNIINDILDLSKIEAGKLEIAPVRYDITSLINDTAQLNCLRYESKPILFSVQIDENTPLELFGDELRIKQVLNNVLSNAFKYTDEGEVVFTVSSEITSEVQTVLTAQTHDNVVLVFKVSDTGHGMSDKQIKKLFDEYTRFDTDANRTTVGTGLGMNITKRLVDLMDGNIIVKSDPGKGSVFTVSIPQKRIGTFVCGPTFADDLRNFRFKTGTIKKKTQFLREYMPYGNVLVVDDVESNIYVTKGLLLPYGLNIETATNGFEAIEKIKNGNVYDIVFMDHMMPKMDGIEATKIIRNMGYTNTIIALTANALIGRAEMFLRNGFDSFISKPIDSRELNLLLNDYIRNKKPPEIVNAARREQKEKNSKTAQTKFAVFENIKSVFEKDAFFVQDAENAITVLSNLYKIIDNIEDDELKLYITTVHGMKSALSNIGEKDLSANAYKLERAGDEKNFSVIANETPIFIADLKTLTEKLKPEDKDSDIELKEEDKVYLREKITLIKTACESFDNNTAKEVLEDLKKKEWTRQINQILSEITVHILHSAFKKAVAAAENLITMI
ncbi:MAG: transporter substrate-binding domain-containing protein [Treponema sp.]|nr:transporter substrate-binding domain-containing protein [Treponema sp.]MCL2250884.1 transporter substrate-binding domain-containing protein [Treponema sp.]